MTRWRNRDCAGRDVREAEVLRILTRYVVEVVEAFELCPWARPARVAGELAVEVVWGTPADADWVAAARRALAQPMARVAMVVAPELAIGRGELGGLRDRVAATLPDAGVAEFHPGAALDLATPARAVPFARRAPDPLLQLVPLALLAAVRGESPAADRARQVAILCGAPADVSVGDRIAAANHATLSRHADAITRVLDDIAADRAASYARAGIVTGCTSR
jgi:hypothetical protein